MNEFHSGNLYWPVTMNDMRTYPALSRNESARVVVIGGGMSGVTCAWKLATTGMDVMLIERDVVAGQSTAANTGLLQYSNDIMLADLIDQIGREPAVTFYKACSQAVDNLAAIASSLPEDCGFRRRSSLYYATTEQDLPKLKREYETLSASGLDAVYWSADDIASRFPFRKPGAIVTGGDAEVNPLRFVHLLADQAAVHGLRIYEQTDIVSHDTLPDGTHRLRTDGGHTIDAEVIIYAIGYEPETLRGKLIRPELRRSFVIATDPVADLSVWHERFLIWETNRPYLYLRTTEDNRIIVGGLDEDDRTPVQSRKGQMSHSERLLELVQGMFPELQLRIAYQWNGTFGESADNLPFIGEDPAWPGVYYMLGYGGNGTVYSMLGADLIRDCIEGKADTNPIKDIVGLTRPTLKTAQPQ